MSDVVVSEFMAESALESLTNDFEVVYAPTLAGDREALLATVADARALVVRNRTIVDAALLAAAPKLKVVGRLGVGLDNIDLDACDSAGVEVRPATGANAVAVAEYVLATALMLVRGTFTSTIQVAEGSWPRAEMVGREVAGRMAGLLGFGDVARRVAGLLGAVGMNVAAHDPYLDKADSVWGPVQPMGFTDLLANSEVLSIHVPLTDETRHLIDADAMAAMPAGAVLINTSRGGIVDEIALIGALRSGHLGGAAVDVFANEPLDGDTGERFRNVPNLLLTPHVAGITVESEERVGHTVVRQVCQVLGA
ncbi:MAG: hydroxyacid dehydrogenase [Acidimicrobiales bacterium]|jgi:(S)-sulfolactate dehydrogenase|nr:hydroxyacid dehydrogenase [Acidimicrobiales bacterium]HJO98440.1 hydroxyacid dehydrogenase [Acidimicrobiales bacterium]|tara:strand:+ start:1416 stop:2342 length:927 start_codon:yes stop_codon:yes gene_type:complete